MRLPYKFRKFLKSLKYWYLRREMVFFADGKMYKFCYVIAMKYFKVAKIVKKDGIYNMEREIASTIKSSSVQKIAGDKKLSFTDIDKVCSENFVEFKGQRLIQNCTTNDCYFFTVDNKEVSPIICYDEGTVKPDELEDIIRTIQKQIQFCKLNDFLRMNEKIEFLFPKIDAFYFEKK